MKKQVDVILLTFTENPNIYTMTKNCIESIFNSESDYDFNIILLETEKTGKFKYTYNNLKTIIPNEDFNYNKFINIGLEHCNNDWVLITNNDTTYEKNWLSEMMKEYEKDNELLSMSPLCPIWHRHIEFINSDKKVFFGYRTSYEITGWSILFRRNILEKIGIFDENFTFWYQDNDYAMTLEKNKIKHALIKNSIVYHFLSQSHSLIDDEKKAELTIGLNQTFLKKWMNNN